MVELMPLAKFMKFQMTPRFLAPISRLKHSSLWRFYTCERFQVVKHIPKLKRLYLYDLPELADEPEAGCPARAACVLCTAPTVCTCV